MRFGRGSNPVANAVPARIMAQPITIRMVKVSPKNIAPHTTAKAGIRKVTEIALAGPMWAMSRKYST